MRLVAERLAATQALGEELLGGVRVKREHVDTVKQLIDEEKESRDKSKRIADTKTYNEQYRRNMGIAVQNSEMVIGLLNDALESLRERNSSEAARHLLEIIAKRGKKPMQARNTGLVAAYNEYKMKTDEGFHEWLRQHGRTDDLEALGVTATPIKITKTKRRRTSDGSSNRPEDY